MSEEAKHTPTRHPLEAYAESYASMATYGDGRVGCHSVEVDIRQNMIPAAVAVAAAELATLRTKLESAEKDAERWCHLALQFDGHRIEALALLRYASEASTSHEAASRVREIRPFLAKPPLPGEAVLAARVVALSSIRGEQP